MASKHRRVYYADRTGRGFMEEYYMVRSFSWATELNGFYSIRLLQLP